MTVSSAADERMPPLVGQLARHAALLLAVWLASIVVYSVAFPAQISALWVVVDLAAVAGCIALAVRRAPATWLGATSSRFLGLAFAIALVCVLSIQLAIPDRDGASEDERQYLATLHTGHPLLDGVVPFNLRWLAPTLAGAVRVLPVDGPDALKAIHFGALVVTAMYLVWLLARLGVQRWLALTAPVFLLCSYLGTYAAANRLVLDPFNYALFVLIAHALLRPQHGRAVSVLLLVAALNSEKALYWVPVIGVIHLLRSPGPLSMRSVLGATRHMVRTALPALIYFGGALALVLTSDATVAASPRLVENVNLMSLLPIHVRIVDPALAKTSFQTLWLPFGAFTIFSLLALRHSDDCLKGVALLLLPVMAQTVIAYDTQRMVAYAFIVYLPLGMTYLGSTTAVLPRALVAGFVAFEAALAIAQHVALALTNLPVRHVRVWLSGAELLAVFAFLWLHAVTRARSRDRCDP